VVIDTSADFRNQMLKLDVRRLDAVVLTHAHNDHISGIDDVRMFNYIQKFEMPVYGSHKTLGELKERFAYIFKKTQEGGGKPKLKLIPIEPGNEIQFKNFHLTVVELHHGEVLVNGYIINNRLAYLTDCNFIPEQTMEKIKGLEKVIIGAIRGFKHSTHFSFSEAVEQIRIIAPQKAYFTHLTHELLHTELENEFSPEITIPYDGYRIPLD
jgi:phosphoribosyl 1,2-cyclic phosphate phosphodiesterase